MAARVNQGELAGVQRLAREPERLARAAAVDRVAEQRMVDVLEVHPDLVRAAGFQPAFDQRRAAEALAAQGVNSFAICFLFSFMNPAHEDRAAAIVRDAAPKAFVSRSSAVLPRIREWPRLSTTLVNAYLEPVVVRYIARADEREELRLRLYRAAFEMLLGGKALTPAPSAPGPEPA